MKGLVLLADYFEDTEALTTTDVLIRAGEQITLAGVNQLQIKTQCGHSIFGDVILKNIDYKTYDYLVIPGGKAAYTILNQDTLVEEVIDYFASNKKLIAAICAGPHLLAKMGLFDYREFTCFPGFEQYSKFGKYRGDLGVVRDECFVTAKSMFYSIEFALNIIAFLYGENKAKQIEKSLKGE